MALWNRINQSKIKFLSIQFKRYYVQIPYDSSLNYAAASSRARVLENPVRGFVKKPFDFCNNVRFFAAPVQANGKKKEKVGGPKLNEKITAQVVRLVTDEGHSVVSLREALEQAKRLDLDLVEVDINANPPVCKLMNFNREKYKKEQKEKGRAKSKSGETLRKGDYKEVRFSVKTEQKDLEMKADAVKKLMDRGYRVKCMAMGNTKRQSKSKGPSNEDPETEEFERAKADKEMLALLSRLTTLIEDVSIVDSGPKAGRKMAYVIVRHVKFGTAKKGGAKMEKLAAAEPTAKQSAPTKSPAMFKKEPAEFDMEAEDDSRPAHDAGDAGLPSSLPENRYRKIEPRNQFPQTSMGTGKRDTLRSESHFVNQRRQPQPQMNATHSMGERKQVRPDPAALRNLKPPHETRKQDASCPETTKPASSYGIFSSAKAGLPGNQGSVADSNKNSQGNSSTGGHGANPNLPSSKSDGAVDQDGQKRFGIFSRGIPK
ncbi:unnamed protein product [Dovyalis caffra]|uniref:Translation initiation factor 3 N-terminal domain-containing protein n=1 Tax=Dovyalis caffra TaxID=77055 RepID=A0AAV1R923_9ROSI|nr:unnamed protein product [Dovyalis caffra]